MKLNKLTLAVCILSLLTGCILDIMAFGCLAFAYYKTTLKDALIPFVTLVVPGTFACLYSIMCIKNPNAKNIRKAFGAVFVLPVIVISYYEFLIYFPCGSSIMLILSTLAAFFFWIGLCRELINNQGLPVEPMHKFWGRGFNLLLSVEVFMLLYSIPMILSIRYKVWEYPPGFFLIFCFILFLAPFAFYGKLEKHRKRLYKKNLPQASATALSEENA